MSYFGTTEFYLQIQLGLVTGYSLVHKFGHGNANTTLRPITQTGVYNTPTTATALEFVSDNAADGVAGAGAIEVTVIGLDSSWAEVSQTVTTNGTTAVALGTDLIRLYRWYVSSTGTYADSTSGSHVGTLTIQESGGGTVWDTIAVTPMATGQSQIGAYTIPINKTGYLIGKLVFTDTSKSADVLFFRRENANDVSTPYSGVMRMLEREVGVTGRFDHHFTAPKGGLIGPCDVGFMASVSVGTADISVEFEIILVND
jgi:hypothetical protein